MSNLKFDTDEVNDHPDKSEQPILPRFLFRDVLKLTTPPDMRNFISAGMRRIHSQLKG